MVSALGIVPPDWALATTEHTAATRTATPDILHFIVRSSEKEPLATFTRAGTGCRQRREISGVNRGRQNVTRTTPASRAVHRRARSPRNISRRAGHLDDRARRRRDSRGPRSEMKDLKDR